MKPGARRPLDPATARIRSGRQAHARLGIFLSGVACASRRQCLVVGHDSSGSGVVVALSPATGAILRGPGVQTIPGTGGVGLGGWPAPCRTSGWLGRLWKVGRSCRTAESRHRRCGMGSASTTSLTKASWLPWPVRRPPCAWRWVGGPASRQWLSRSTRNGRPVEGRKRSIHIGAGGNVDGRELSVRFFMPRRGQRHR